MPGARTHDLITVVTAVGADAVYMTQARPASPVLAGLFTLTYLFAGYACAGDLDLDSKEYRRWGPLRILWLPYRMLVPHRSWVSHGLLMGGLIRAAYLALGATAVLWVGVWAISRLGPHLDPGRVASDEWRSVFTLAHAHPQEAYALLAGFVLAGTAHSLADIIATGLKRRF